MKLWGQLVAGLIILSILGGCVPVGRQGGTYSTTGQSRESLTIQLDNIPPIDSLIGDSPYLKVLPSEFRYASLPPEERYERTDDGKIIVKSQWGLYDPGFDFGAYMEGRDPRDGKPYYEEFVLDHMRRKYDQEFELGPSGHPFKTATNSGALYVLGPDGEETKVRYAASFTDDGKVGINTADNYIQNLIGDAEKDTVVSMIKEELARRAPEIMEPHITFSTYDPNLPQVFGGGATFRDVDAYCLRYMKHGYDTSVSISYDFGFTPEREEELTELAFSIAIMLQENNYNGGFTMYHFSSEDWALKAAGTQFPPGQRPDEVKRIYIGFGYYTDYVSSHYTNKEPVWKDRGEL